MVKFDSNEYWQKITWDRYEELNKVPISVRNEFLVQEYLTVTHIQELAKKKETIKILDLACGTGRISESIIKANFGKLVLTLADFNKNTLNQVKQNLQAYNNINYILLDAYKLGDYFKDEFDIVICMDFFHHISKLHLLAKQINTALKPDGVIIANAFDKDKYNKWDRIKYGYIKSTRRRLLFSLTNLFYPCFTDKMKNYVDKNGWARIDSLTEEEIVHCLSPYFGNINFTKSYYLWFNASKILPSSAPRCWAR